MKILSIETSTKNFSLAVVRDDKIVAEQNIILNGVLSSSMIPSVDKILKKSKVPLTALDGFVVGLGPGSFTSLRVGLSTVKGLAFATKKPVVGIGSLDAIAMNVNSKNNQQICVIVDAKRNLVYAALYVRNDKGLMPITKYLLCPVGELLKKINKDTLMVGDGIKLFKDEISRRAKAPITFADEKEWYPKARHLAYLAKVRLHEKKFDNPDTLIPLYLYPDDCQVAKT